MPNLEEIALRDLVKNPKAFILYAACIAIGWVVNRVIPDDCHREVTRWQSLYYVSDRRRDSLQTTKDVLYEQLLTEKQQNIKLKQADNHTDSLLIKLSHKAETVLKPKKHHDPAN
jgi:hypothetical protein